MFPSLLPSWSVFPLFSVHFQAGRGRYLAPPMVLHTQVTHLHSIIHTSLPLRRPVHSFIFSRAWVTLSSTSLAHAALSDSHFGSFCSLLYSSLSFVCRVPALTAVLACPARPASNLAVRIHWELLTLLTFSKSDQLDPLACLHIWVFSSHLQTSHEWFHSYVWFINQNMYCMLDTVYMFTFVDMCFTITPSIDFNNVEKA